MTYLILGVIALLIGNGMAKRGVEAARGECGPPKWTPGEIALSVGTGINMVGGVLLLIGLWSLIFH